MSAYNLTPQLAQKIVDRTMDIIDCNINVMNEQGQILGSGDQERIGELHEGAMLAITQQRVVIIDSEAAKSLHGVKPGINLPLHLNNKIVGAIGLTGEPIHLKQFGQLVCMSAEMMMEQAQLLNEVSQDNRLREEFVQALISNHHLSTNTFEWAKMLNIDPLLPRVAAIIEVDNEQLDIETAMSELQSLQNLIETPNRSNLVAIQSLTELVVLIPALNRQGQWDIQEQKNKLEQLVADAHKISQLKIRIALGNYFSQDSDNIAKSYNTAKTTLLVGKQRMPAQRNYYYQDLILPVLLNELSLDWKAEELLLPLKKLKASDNNGTLRETLRAWFTHNTQAGETAAALSIHRNTLEYRLNKIATLTQLNLSSLDDKLLLYIGLQLDKS